ncbi:UNVERIFIED_CONTAM: hypothetical protein PYX00_004276 [Menopon gallinae]|uniref:Uncharacterized protein n=1 Tax=Menopon gallinae TaxID=328185 RepID=A0AAW2I4K8_9NEOP
MGSQSPDPFQPNKSLQRSPFKRSSSLGYITSTPESEEGGLGRDESEEIPRELHEILMFAAQSVEEILAGCPTTKRELRSGVLHMISLVQEVFCNAKSGGVHPDAHRKRNKDRRYVKRYLHVQQSQKQMTYYRRNVRKKPS